MNDDEPTLRKPGSIVRLRHFTRYEEEQIPEFAKALLGLSECTAHWSEITGAWIIYDKHDISNTRFSIVFGTELASERDSLGRRTAWISAITRVKSSVA